MEYNLKNEKIELINLNIDSFLNLRSSKNTHCVNFLMVSPTENKLKLQKLQQKNV
jgi:hypothetical protein